MNAHSLDRRFSFERAALVLRNRLYEEAPTLGVGLAVIVGVNALGFLLSKRFFFNGNGGQLWTMAMVLGGILLAAQAFRGMHDGKSGTDWLLLPASPLEKFSAAVVDYVVLYPIAASIAAMALSALFSLIEMAVGRPGGTIWTPFSLHALADWGQYAVTATIFIAGSASFRKASLLKTLGMMVAYAFVLTLVLAAGAWIISKAHGFDNSSFSFMNGDFRITAGEVPKSAQEAFMWIYRISWYVMVPLFGLAYGYLRVFEKEARDEVQ
jgi:hypothetical protein